MKEIDGECCVAIYEMKVGNLRWVLMELDFYDKSWQALDIYDKYRWALVYDTVLGIMTSA